MAGVNVAGILNDIASLHLGVLSSDKKRLRFWISVKVSEDGPADV